MLRSLLLAIVITTSIANAGEMDPAPWNFRVLYDLSTMTDKTQFSHALAVGLQKAGMTEKLQDLVESTGAIDIGYQLELMVHETFLKLPESVQRSHSEMIVDAIGRIEKHAPELYKKLMHVLTKHLRRIFSDYQEVARAAVHYKKKYLTNVTAEQKQSREEVLRVFGLTEDKVNLTFSDVMKKMNGSSFHEMVGAIAEGVRKAPTLARLKELLCKSGLSEDDMEASVEKLRIYTREHIPSVFYAFMRSAKNAAYIHFAGNYSKYFKWRQMEDLIRWYVTLAYRPWKTIHGHKVDDLHKQFIRLLRLTSKDMLDSFFRMLDSYPDYIQDKMMLLHKKIQDSGEKLAVLGLDVTRQSLAHYKEVPQEIKDRAAFIFKPGNVYTSLITRKHYAFNLYIPKDNNKRQAALKSVLEVAESLRPNIGDKSADNVVRLAKTLLGGERFC